MPFWEHFQWALLPFHLWILIICSFGHARGGENPVL
jgi:hypothetical protein